MISVQQNFAHVLSSYLSHFLGRAWRWTEAAAAVEGHVEHDLALFSLSLTVTSGKRVTLEACLGSLTIIDVLYSTNEWRGVLILIQAQVR